MMRKKTGSLLWKIQTWTVVVSAILAYQAGAMVAAVILGGFAALLFWVDFKVGMQEELEHADQPSALLNDYLMKVLPFLLAGVCIIIAVQVVMAFVYSRMPTPDAPFLCFLCTN